MAQVRMEKTVKFVIELDEDEMNALAGLLMTAVEFEKGPWASDIFDAAPNPVNFEVDTDEDGYFQREIDDNE